MYNEKTFQSEFGKKNLIDGFFELKISKGKSIRFDSLQEHQRDALIKISGGKGLYHKLTDPPIFYGMQTRFNAKRPFDCFRVCFQNAYVVVMFYTPRQRKNVYYVRILNWIEAEKEATKKSITEEDLKLRACLVENYLKNR